MWSVTWRSLLDQLYLTAATATHEPFRNTLFGPRLMIWRRWRRYIELTSDLTLANILQKSCFFMLESIFPQVPIEEYSMRYTGNRGVEAIHGGETTSLPITSANLTFGQNDQSYTDPQDWTPTPPDWRSHHRCFKEEEKNHSTEWSILHFLSEAIHVWPVYHSALYTLAWLVSIAQIYIHFSSLQKFCQRHDCPVVEFN